MFKGIELTDNIAIVATLAAWVTLAYTLVSYFVARKAQRVNITLDAWKIWVSKDYREFRTASFREIKRLKKSAPLGKHPAIGPLLDDPQIDMAIGSVEHFFSELSGLKSMKLLDEKLYKTLFFESALSWKDILANLERNAGDLFSDEELYSIFRILLGDCIDRESPHHDDRSSIAQS